MNLEESKLDRRRMFKWYLVATESGPFFRVELLARKAAVLRFLNDKSHIKLRRHLQVVRPKQGKDFGSAFDWEFDCYVWEPNETAEFEA